MGITLKGEIWVRIGTSVSNLSFLRGRQTVRYIWEIIIKFYDHNCILWLCWCIPIKCNLWQKQLQFIPSSGEYSYPLLMLYFRGSLRRVHILMKLVMNHINKSHNMMVSIQHEHGKKQQMYAQRDRHTPNRWLHLVHGNGA